MSAESRDHDRFSFHWAVFVDNMYGEAQKLCISFK